MPHFASPFATALCLSLALTVSAQHATAEQDRVTRSEAFGDWSVFCDDICWTATLTSDRDWTVMITRWDTVRVEFSVMRNDGAPLASREMTLHIGCFSDALLIADGVAYASTRAMDPEIIHRLGTTNEAYLHDNRGVTRVFYLKGFDAALRETGYKVAPGLPARSGKKTKAADCFVPSS